MTGLYAAKPTTSSQSPSPSPWQQQHQQQQIGMRGWRGSQNATDDTDNKKTSSSEAMPGTRGQGSNEREDKKQRGGSGMQNETDEFGRAPPGYNEGVDDLAYPYAYPYPYPYPYGYPNYMPFHYHHAPSMPYLGGPDDGNDFYAFPPPYAGPASHLAPMPYPGYYPMYPDAYAYGMPPPGAVPYNFRRGDPRGGNKRANASAGKEKNAAPSYVERRSSPAPSSTTFTGTVVSRTPTASSTASVVNSTNNNNE